MIRGDTSYSMATEASDLVSVLDYEYSDFEDDNDNGSGTVKNNENGEDDDDDDDNDEMNVIIDEEVLAEKNNLRVLLSNDPLANVPIQLPATYKQQYSRPYVTDTYNTHEFDIDMKNEINKLLKLSMSPSTNKSIAVLVNNQLILTPVT